MAGLELGHSSRRLDALLSQAPPVLARDETIFQGK